MHKQISGAAVTLVEDAPETTDGVVRIAGSPEQADKAQSLLQGFILSSASLSIFLIHRSSTLPLLLCTIHILVTAKFYIYLLIPFAFL